MEPYRILLEILFSRKAEGLCIAPRHADEDIVIFGMELRNLQMHGVVTEFVLFIEQFSSLSELSL